MNRVVGLFSTPYHHFKLITLELTTSGFSVKQYVQSICEANANSSLQCGAEQYFFSKSQVLSSIPHSLFFSVDKVSIISSTDFVLSPISAILSAMLSQFLLISAVISSSFRFVETINQGLHAVSRPVFDMWLDSNSPVFILLQASLCLFF